MVLDEGIVLTFCVSYFNAPLHLCMNFNPKIQQQNCWPLRGDIICIIFRLLHLKKINMDSYEIGSVFRKKDNCKKDILDVANYIFLYFIHFYITGIEVEKLTRTYSACQATQTLLLNYFIFALIISQTSSVDTDKVSICCGANHKHPQNPSTP